MLSFLLFVVGVLIVGGLLFLGASLLLGRGETQPPADLDRSPVELPDDRPIAGDDLRALQISVAFRGYRMTEVDWLLDQFAQAFDERDAQLAERDAELAALRARLTEAAREGQQWPQVASEGTDDDEGEPAPEEAGRQPAQNGPRDDA